MAFPASSYHRGRVHSVSGFFTGALERSNPIPPGTYWVDVFQRLGVPASQDPYAHFRAWLSRNADVVQVLKHESRAGSPPYDFHHWYLFQVTAPTIRWTPHEGLDAFPSIAAEGSNTTIEDTAYNEPTPWNEFLPDIMKNEDGGTATWVKVGAVTVVIGVGAWFLQSGARLLGR